MAPEQSASADCFVVKSSGGAAVREALGKLGAVEEIDDSGLLLVRLHAPEGEPEAAWRSIVERLDAVDWASPLFIDEAKGEHFPTGEISVRFGHPPTDAGLERFAATHGLAVRSRNEFVPEQATFVPLEPRRTYLPHLVQTLAEAEDVARAWANTASRYQRG
jgi:hypothetical protein